MQRGEIVVNGLPARAFALPPRSRGLGVRPKAARA
jgi:hypothetical protein